MVVSSSSSSLTGVQESYDRLVERKRQENQAVLSSLFPDKVTTNCYHANSEQFQATNAPQTGSNKRKHTAMVCVLYLYAKVLSLDVQRHTAESQDARKVYAF